ncbi:hypothetical protein Pint_20084 [Pistacia integerrima]|uniref:Uncharacterized protein n=1 Tax=Pistacia integerrima TaxID=434235 RepID=A0ACC0XA70_9ROSI|nr:hypothetical protein Pint_20084 [Pistacia integerrima]
MASSRKLIVEVVDARDLMPKDGHGTSSPYVSIDYYGKRRRTRTVIRDLNPSWNEVLEFDEGKPSEVFSDILELDVYHDKNYGPTRRNNFLGRLRLNSSQFVKKGEEALIYYPLEKKSLLSWIQGEIGLKIYYVDAVPAPPVPPPEKDPPVPEEAKPEEAKPDEKAEAPSSTEPSPPADEKPAEEPSEGEGKAETEAAPQPPAPENAAPEGEKEPQPDTSAPPPPQQEQPPEAKDQEPPQNAQEQDPPQPVQEQGDIEFDLSGPQWDPPVAPSEHVMAASMSGSQPQVKLAPPINSPLPVSRTVSMVSYASDPPDNISIERSSFDLVEKMHYLFVRAVKARFLPTNGSPVVKISIGNNRTESKPARKTSFFEWDQTFAFSRDSPESSAYLEVSLWDPPRGDVSAEGKFLGGICFDVTEIPLRDPPDSPLAPQWYRLEGGGAHNGDLMLATWIGTQADESFPDAWKTDTAGHVNSKAKVYVSPKLWYLRATVIEAQDILSPVAASREASFTIKAQLGFQVQKTKVSVTRNGTPSWNEDLLFVVAEPLMDHLTFVLENRQPKGPVTLGITKIPLTTIERRVDDRKVVSRWFSFENTNDDKRVYKGRVHLRLCFDGGYHVMDEAAHVCSDYRPNGQAAVETAGWNH